MLFLYNVYNLLYYLTMTDIAIERGRTRILYGAENSLLYGSKFMQNVKKKMDITFDHRAPSIVIKIPQYYNGYKNILKRGGKIRCITEITKDNIQYCKDLLNIVSELRHLDGLKGGIAMNESEYMATTILQEEQPLTEVIFSNVEEVVSQGQYIFDTFWNNAIPAIKKIKEIEEGIVSYQTKIIEDFGDSIIENEIKKVIQNSTELNACSSPCGLTIGYNYFIPLVKQVLERKKNGLHKGIRFLIEINKNNLELAKIFLDIGVDIRHVKDIIPLSFNVTDNELLAAIEKTENGGLAKSILYSNEPSYLKHFKNLFEELWKKSKDPQKIIKSIEEESELSFIETIESTEESFKLVHSLLAVAKDEILVILPTINSLCRQIKFGMFEHIKNIAVTNRTISIKILINEEIDYQNQQEINLLLNNENILFQNKNNVDFPFDFQLDRIENLKIRTINNGFKTEMGLIVVDKNKSIIIESTNNYTNNSLNAIGMASYSNSIHISKSYKSIFDTLWEQTEIYGQLKQAHEHLKIQDKMQKEFVNIAAHELRTPIQPILGLTELVKNKIKDKEEKELLEVVIKNTKRLKNLAENILDVALIEGRLLNINKEYFNLNKLILNISEDFINDIDKKKQIKFEYKNFTPNYIIYADTIKIGQVVSSLFDNSIKNILGEGIISITLERKEININDNKIHFVVVHVKDNGSGIDNEIISKLFTKFASKSFQGTGLGLFISKNIVEMHGGKIWGTNNKDNKGATFSFSLPLND
jgi:two-component system, OmpR family, sensor histidine kinase VicK